MIAINHNLLDNERELERDIEDLNAIFETAHPQDILIWAWRTFGPHVGASSSFQTQSVPLLHMIANHAPWMRIFFLDTGFHFAETLAFRDQLRNEWRLNVQNIEPDMGHERFKRCYGELYRHNPDMCCYINKVEPWRRVRRTLDAWISGIRRDQTLQRRNIPIITRQTDGTYKIAPLATWSKRDIWHYRDTHNLPEHPLQAQGYQSIGCAPCTYPVDATEEERAGRWKGNGKTECGIHTLE